MTLVTAGRDREPSLRLRLLADLRAVFGDADRMPTAGILAALVDIEDAPWGDLGVSRWVDAASRRECLAQLARR